MVRIGQEIGAGWDCRGIGQEILARIPDHNLNLLERRVILKEIRPVGTGIRRG
jgi:hypothetical protein